MKTLTCGACNDTLPPSLWGQMRHLIVSPTELETEDWEHILPLEKDLAFQAITEVDSMV